MRGLNPTQALPRLEFKSQEKEFPQNMTVRTSGDSGSLNEKEGIKNSNVLKSPTHRFTHLQTLTLGSGGGSAGERDIQKKTDLCGSRQILEV